MNRPDISRLRKNRSMHLKIGMLLSLSFMILAFNWTSYDREEKPDPNTGIEIVEEIAVLRTPRENPPEPPPAVVEPTSNIEEIETPEFTTERIVDPVEITPLEDVVEKIVAPAPMPKAVPEKRPAPPVYIEEPELDIPEIFTVVEEMPRFPWCESEDMSKVEKRRCAEEKLLRFVAKNTKYPMLAKDSAVEGTVVMNFVVNEDGSISDVTIARDIGAGCGTESVRVINKMPKWIPGKQIGRPVKVRFTLPIKYRLE